MILAIEKDELDVLLRGAVHMNNGKKAKTFGIVREALRKIIRKIRRLFSDKPDPIAPVKQKTANSLPLNPGRGNIRWKDYHPEPPAQKTPKRSREMNSHR